MSSATMTISPVEFSYEDLTPDDAEFLRAKAAYINARRHINHQLIVEMGSALLEAKTRLPGVFLPWATAEFKVSHDTLENYMNVARNLPALPQEQGALFQARALYHLAGKGVTDESRAQAGQIAESGRVVDYETAYILADAPLEIKERYLAETLTKADAYNLAKVLNKKTTPPAVKAVCLTNGVSAPEVVEYLTQAYNDVSKGRETWGDIAADEFQLNGMGWSVPLSQARLTDLERYRVDRAFMHRDNAPRRYQWVELAAPVQHTKDGRDIIVIDRPDLKGLEGQSLTVQVRIPIKESW